MSSFRTAVIFTSLQGVLLLTSSGAVVAQTQPLTPQQLKASLAGMTKEQVKEKFMASAAKGLHFSDTWPTNFPMPKYTSNVTQTRFVNSTKGRVSASAYLTTKDPAQTVFQFYLDACRRDGWKVRTPTVKALENTRAATNFYMLEGNKEKKMIRLFCTQDPKTHATNLSIMWFKTDV
ncbi:hypothetical protein BH10CYA1_BH10CYA1_61030 [soil metagenome]